MDLRRRHPCRRSLCTDRLCAGVVGVRRLLGRLDPREAEQRVHFAQPLQEQDAGDLGSKPGHSDFLLMKCG